MQSQFAQTLKRSPCIFHHFHILTSHTHLSVWTCSITGFWIHKNEDKNQVENLSWKICSKPLQKSQFKHQQQNLNAKHQLQFNNHTTVIIAPPMNCANLSPLIVLESQRHSNTQKGMSHAHAHAHENSVGNSSISLWSHVKNVLDKDNIRTTHIYRLKILGKDVTVKFLGFSSPKTNSIYQIINVCKWLLVCLDNCLHEFQSTNT